MVRPRDLMYNMKVRSFLNKEWFIVLLFVYSAFQRKLVSDSLLGQETNFKMYGWRATSTVTGQTALEM